MKEKVFLTAEWKNLIMANYIVDPAILQPYLPAKTELDHWNNRHYVSLVGFLFRDVRVKGMRIPFHINFPEVNLRFYVRSKNENEWKRGVVFISEIVPKRAIAFTANTFFKEHYAAMPMKHEWEQEEQSLFVTYKWKKRGKWNKLMVKASMYSETLQSGSEEEFITEHFWGYSAFSKDRTAEYHVEHPRWNIHPVRSFTIDCDFETLYGQNFGFLQQQAPSSVFLADGSAIKVFSKKVL